MLGSIAAWGQVLKWGGLALIVAGATWWLLSTVEKAREADRLAVEVSILKAEARARETFEDQVDALRATVDARMGVFVSQARTDTQRVLDRIAREVPSGSPCFSRETVSILNSRRGTDEPAR